MRAPSSSVITIVTFSLALTGFGSLPAQNPPPATQSAPPPTQTPPDTSAPILSQADLDQLVGPIALYPDPLIALVLPASTVPTDIVLANRYVTDGKDADAIDKQNWDDSVKGLARYPDVLKMMDENLDWTNQLGAAVLAQQEDVMAAIQRQRAKAQTLGNLQTTPQQQVIVEKQVIQIVPADPQVIYVPTYNPQVVYVQPAPPAAPLITFGVGFAMGLWIGGGCDWYHHGIYSHGYYRPGYGWGGNYGNDVNVNINNSNNVNVWKPNNNRPAPRPPYNPNRPGNGGGLPGWNQPPGGNRPGNGNGGINRPGNGNNNGPGNGNGGVNRPGNGNNGPGNGIGGQRPENKPGANRPTTKPATRPSENTKPAFSRPSQTGGQRPEQSRPNAGSQRPKQTRENRPAQNRPSQQSRPAQSQRESTKRSAGGGGGGGGNRQGGGGGQRGGRNQG